MNIQTLPAQTIIDLSIKHPYPANDTEFLLELNEIIDSYEVGNAVKNLWRSYPYDY